MTGPEREIGQVPPAAARAPVRGGRDPARLRFADEWVGLLVLAALLLFGGAVFEAGVLHQWLRPSRQLYITLPETGTDGLALGADVEVIGIHAGTIRRIRLNPHGSMYAVAEIDPDVGPFIRRDSTATIELRFAVAGAAYVEITRGHGAPMDWHYAVIAAKTAPNPADTIATTITEIRDRVLPALDHAEHMTATLDAMATALQQGKGSVGQLLSDDRLIRDAEATIASLDATIAALKPIENRAGTLLGHADVAATHLDAASADLARATPRLPAITKNAQDATADLPSLLVQTELTAAQLEKLVIQLRGSWLLGGGKVKPPATRLPPSAVQP